MAAVRTQTSPLLLTLFFVLLSSISRVAISDDAEAEALLKLKGSLNKTQALDSSWKSGTNPCDTAKRWDGLMCSNGFISGLRLINFGLSGYFDCEPLTNLKHLRMISIENNSFSGKIPDFNKLGMLKALSVQKNQFSGEIPEDYFTPMTSLKKIYFAYNKFSGTIPESLTKLENLIDLYLEYNEFSGPVPLFPQTSITRINLSHNKLEGEIPEGMVKYGAKVFEENPGLCSAKLGKECPPGTPTAENADNAASGEATESKGSSTKWIILGVVGLLLVVLLFKAQPKEDHAIVPQKENLDERAPLPPPSSNKRSMSSSSRGNSMRSASRRGSQNGRSGGSELVVINDEKGIFGLPDLMKAAAEVLGNGGLGSAYKAAMSNGVCVVVKRVRDMNKLNKDAFDAEMRRLGKLKHPNILPPLAYHYRKEEKLFVSEYIPKGSLLYLLHGDRGLAHAELNWPTRLKIIKGIARGMGFLHTEFASYELPHGNLKSSNILLASNYEPLLTDYALHPMINSTPTAQALFAYKSPEAILYQQVTPKSDVYCLGIVILEVLTGKFPSQYLNNQKSGTDVVQWVKTTIHERRELELIDPEIATATNSLGQMEKLLHIGAACVESNHDTRIDMKEAIKRIEEIQV